MAGDFQPLDQKFAIVDDRGRPTDYFIRWAQQKQIDIGEAITLAGLEEYLLAHPLQEGSGIQLTPDGNLANSPTIAADVQAILDQISTMRGAILYRGAADWVALNPGTAGHFLQTAGAGADPVWAAGSGGGGGALLPCAANANKYLPPDAYIMSANTAVASTGIIAFYPFSKNTTIDEIACEVTTAIAASNLRLALYDSSGPNGGPGVLIQESANISTATTGVKTFVLSAPHSVTEMVWLAAQWSAGVTIRAGVRNEMADNIFGATAFNAAATFTRLLETQAFGAFPATATTTPTFSAGNGYIVARVA